MLSNIPEELRLLKNWVVFRHETRNDKPTKMPYQVNGYKADVTDCDTWTTFEIASAAQGFDGIGFVLSQHLGYTIIDLDNKPENPCTEEELQRHNKIFEKFNSYTETSISGSGVHIIVRGTVPSGINRDHVEVYSHARYMVCTGNVIRNQPIQDYQALLDILYAEMKPPEDERTELEQIEGLLSDEELVAMAMNAENAAKFNSLSCGQMEGYKSQSEADLALLAILSFYTPDNEQVRRLFRMSALGKRDKAIRNNTYLNYALGLIRAKQPAPIDFSQLEANVEKMMQPPPAPHVEIIAPAPPPPPINSSISAAPIGDLPPGLVGELANYFYQAATRPVPEIALAASIAVIAGVCARTYNVSNVGLNQYIIVLARTGAGKEDAASGIEKLFAAVRPTIPMIDGYMGPAAFASGQALGKRLAEQPCFVSVLGEFGLTLQQISDSRANNAEKMLKKVLLDIYGKSGQHRSLQSSVYSDVEKNTAMVRAPNVTILGESTPETFFEGMDVSHIAEGLIPRFTIIEYTGPRPPRNPNAGFLPSKELTQRFADLAVASISMNNNNTCNQVSTDSTGGALLDAFDVEADAHVNHEGQSMVESQLWNRAHLKALKLSALIAVGINPHNPVINAQCAQWAIDFVRRDIIAITKRFLSGDVGMGDAKQISDVKAAVQSYFTMSKKTRNSYLVPNGLFEAKVIPYSYLQRRTVSLSSFRGDKAGATTALKKCIQILIDSGMLLEVSKPDLIKKFDFSGVAYAVSSKWA